jgi:hypothetical protein
MTVSAVKEDVTHSLITEVMKDPILMVFIYVNQGKVECTSCIYWQSLVKTIKLTCFESNKNIY